MEKVSATPHLDALQDSDEDGMMATGCVVLTTWINSEGHGIWGYGYEGDMDVIGVFGLLGRMAAELQKDITLRAMEEPDGDK